MKKLIVMMLSSVALLSTSCSKDSQDIESALPSLPAQAEAPKVAGSLVLNLTGSTEQARAMSYDGLDRDGKTILSSSDQDWSTTFFIRNEAGTVQFTATMKWTASARQGNKFNLTSPKNNKGVTQLTLVGTGTLPAKGETWYISGILGGGTLEQDGTSMRFDNSAAITTSSNKGNIPYAFGWTPFTVGDEATPAKVAVHFQPLGVQLVLKADQWQGKLFPEQYMPLPQARIITNTLTQDGYFDFALGKKPVANELPKFVYGASVASESVDTLKAQLGVHGELLSAMIWAMPKDKTIEPAEPKTRPCIRGYIVDKRGTTTEHGLRRGNFKSGATYEVKLSVFRPRLPLEMLAERIMSENHQTFAKELTSYGDVQGSDPNANDGSMDEYISSIDALDPNHPNNYVNGRFINGRHWRLPSESDWASIFFRDSYQYRGSAGWTPTTLGKPSLIMPFWEKSIASDTYSEEASGFDFTEDRGSITWGPRNRSITIPKIKPFYLLRYQDPTYKNVFLTAYRYEYFYSKDKPYEAYLKVTARYLGSKSQATIATISNEDFWNSNTSDDITRFFPIMSIIKKDNQGVKTLDFGNFLSCTHYVTARNSYGNFSRYPHIKFGRGSSMTRPLQFEFTNIDEKELINVLLIQSYCCDLNDVQYQH